MDAIVILKAKGSQGKSGTLMALIDRIKSDAKFEVIDETLLNGFDKFLLAKSTECTVAVIAAGDPGEEGNVEDCLKKCKDAHANIIFAASRSRGGVYNLHWYFAEDNNYVRIDTAPLASTDTTPEFVGQLNLHTAQYLKSLIPILAK